MSGPSPEAGGPAPRRRLEANLIAADVEGGRIAENIVSFARLLRAAGLPVGPQKVVLAVEAVLAAGIDSPKTLFWALHAVFVNRRTEHEIFTQAFVMFWRDPGFLEQMLSLMLPSMRGGGATPEDQALSRRMSESLFRNAADRAPQEQDKVELDAAETWSGREILRQKDFEQMSAEELRSARRAIERMRLPFEEIRTRRFEAARSGRLDIRRMMRSIAAHGGDMPVPAFRQRRWRRPPIVVLCDISGSMDTYARVLLHFLYALTNDRDRVSSFLFGTRLTNVTRALRARDPDVAISKVTKDVVDWSGGTRIGHCLEEFNRKWARRVLGQNALVLLFTDGLDREGAEGIEHEARRLRANCRRLIWLNPLMRYDRYAPLALGARALASQAGEMRSCHNLQSLEELARALADDGGRLRAPVRAAEREQRGAPA